MKCVSAQSTESMSFLYKNLRPTHFYFIFLYIICSNKSLKLNRMAWSITYHVKFGISHVNAELGYNVQRLTFIIGYKDIFYIHTNEEKIWN